MSLNKHKSSLLTLVLALMCQFVFAQAFKPGEQVEALINNSWQPVKILKLVSGKTDVYDVQAVTVTGKSSQVTSNYQVNEKNLRSLKKATTTTTAAANTPTASVSTKAVETGSLHLGKYNIYSGIPFMYIGHFELQPGGNYIVALASDDDSYATGTYTYDAASNTITWKTGFFWQKKWEGKVNAAGRILFNHSTYGDVK